MSRLFCFVFKLYIKIHNIYFVKCFYQVLDVFWWWSCCLPGSYRASCCLQTMWEILFLNFFITPFQSVILRPHIITFFNNKLIFFAVKKLWRDIEDETLQLQMKEYLHVYPNPIAVVLRAGQDTKAIRNGKFESCTVLQLDGSLLQICFKVRINPLWDARFLCERETHLSSTSGQFNWHTRGPNTARQSSSSGPRKSTVRRSHIRLKLILH